MHGMRTKSKVPLNSFAWKFIPADALNGDIRIPTHPPPEAPHAPAGLDVESHYTAFIEDARVARLADPEAADLVTRSAQDAPGFAAALRTKVGADTPAHRVLQTAKRAQGAGGDEYEDEVEETRALVHEIEARLNSEAEQASADASRRVSDTSPFGSRRGTRAQNVGGVDADGALGDMREADVEEGGRAPSPVIIWRHAAPVKVATNIPPELVAKPRRKSVDASGPSEAKGDALSRPLALRGPTKRVANTWGKSAPRPRSNKLPYGAWYLPPESWGKEAPPHDGEAAMELVKVRDPSALLSQSTSAADAAAAGITSKVGSQYSSRMFKDFLKQNNWRVPEYLQRVETPTKALSVLRP